MNKKLMSGVIVAALGMGLVPADARSASARGPQQGFHEEEEQHLDLRDVADDARISLLEAIEAARARIRQGTLSKPNSKGRLPPERWSSSSR